MVLTYIKIGPAQPIGEPRQGIGLSETLKSMQYGFIQSGKIDWTIWEFKPEITDYILFNYNTLRAKHTVQLQEINYSSSFQRNYIVLFRWLRGIWDSQDCAWTFLRKFDAISAVWLWTSEILVWEFLKEVFKVLVKDGVLEVENDENRQWIPNRACFYINGLNIDLQEEMEFSTSIGRTVLERLLHL